MTAGTQADWAEASLLSGELRRKPHVALACGRSPGSASRDPSSSA